MTIATVNFRRAMVVNHVRSMEGIKRTATNAAKFAIQTSEKSLRYIIRNRYRRSFKNLDGDKREAGCSTAELLEVDIFPQAAISHPLQSQITDCSTPYIHPEKADLIAKVLANRSAQHT